MEMLSIFLATKTPFGPLYSGLRHGCGMIFAEREREREREREMASRI
jgi:hypothetical protein